MLFRLGLFTLFGEDPEAVWRFLRLWLPAVLRVLAPSAGYGVSRIPSSGGAVLAANHLSAIDPPAIGVYSTRTIRYMAKVELLSVPIVGELLRMAGSFGVRRGEGDRDALRVARWLVREGHVVGMFMEGTRQKLGYPGPAHSGAAVVAMQESVPVVPCGIEAFGWSLDNPRPFAVVFGDPLDLGGLGRNGRGYKEGAAIVEAELVRLWRLAGEAVADGFPERLRDGTPREDWPRVRDVYRSPGRPWPTEPWAEESLGPVYRARR
ncbi:MAG TPA: lysophospholipid acyltransferase family protein [Gaiellaceae bacterium]|nr:lysophospholipid acyltransferase family protein [Gaiellaceae bacterium]